MPPPKAKLETPAPAEKADELHSQLVKTGQALGEDELKSFILTSTDADGAITAGCKGEIAFQSAHISELWVDEQQRGKGVGGFLLECAESHAQTLGCTRIHLETRSEAARRLYEKQGYSIFGKLPDYDGDIPLYYLVKAL